MTSASANRAAEVMSKVWDLLRAEDISPLEIATVFAMCAATLTVVSARVFGHDLEETTANFIEAYKTAIRHTTVVADKTFTETKH